MRNILKTLRRLVLPCFTPSATAGAATTTTPRKRLSSSSLDDTQEKEYTPTAVAAAAPPRPSRTMVIGTIFGHRRGHVWLCFQNDRLSPKPTLLLELSIPTHLLVKEMQSGFVRVTLSTRDPSHSQIGLCPLHSVPLWTLSCNGKQFGFAARRKPTDQILAMLKTMQSITVGAGAIPSESASGSDPGDDLIMYMRANYECAIGGLDSESFHLINPDECPGQELSIFLLRSR